MLKRLLLPAAMLRIWHNVLTKPSEKTFADEQTSVSLPTVLAWIFLVSMVATTLIVMRMTLAELWETPRHELEPYYNSLTHFLGQVNSPFLRVWFALTNLRMETQEFYATLWLRSGLFDIAFDFAGSFFYYFLSQIPQQVFTAVRGLLSPVLFLINVFLYHYSARFLGGRGQLDRFAFLMFSFAAPMIFLRVFVGSVPLIIGTFVSALPGVSPKFAQNLYHTLNSPVANFVQVALTVYWLTLAYFALKAEYKLHSIRTLIVIAFATAAGFFIRNFPSDIYLSVFEAARMLH